MRRAALVLLSVFAFAFFTGPRSARAQDRTDPLQGEHRAYESPQHFAIELRLASYRPDIDSDPNLHGQTPYNDVFGSTNHFEIAMEFDWQVLRIPHFGTIGPGAAIGYTTMSEYALLTNGNGARSGEQTSLSIYPMYVVAVARADFLDREIGIPVVPYAKLGLGYALWTASNDLGTSSYQGVTGKGHSIGTQAALGLSLDLNVFDQYAARNFDNAAGVNHTYFFAEYFSSNLSGFVFQHNPLRVGTTSWAFGLAFEF